MPTPPPLSSRAARRRSSPRLLLILGAALGSLILFAPTAAANPLVDPSPTPAITSPEAPAEPGSPGAEATEVDPDNTDPQPGAGSNTESETRVTFDLDGSGRSALSSPVLVVLLLGSITLLPALLITVTAFTRIAIVLGFVRSALGTTGVPPNQVIIGLSLFLTFFVMSPALSQANDEALQPFLAGTITQEQAVDRGIQPFREFMLAQVREEDLSLFIRMAGDERPADPAEVSTTTLVPAFVISELRTAFLIGFVIFVPFIIIDLVVSAALSAMGMVMLPPVLISLPFKLLLFVAADGWHLVVESLVDSFHAV